MYLLQIDKWTEHQVEIRWDELHNRWQELHKGVDPPEFVEERRKAIKKVLKTRSKEVTESAEIYKDTC